MISSKRSREEIVAAILQIAGSPARSTWILYRTNLSFAQLRSYMQLIIDRGLIAKTTDEKWLITERGRSYLQDFDKLQRLIAPKELQSTPLIHKSKVTRNSRSARLG